MYLRTAPLTASQADSLEVVLAGAPFRVKHVATRRVPGGAARGKVQLARGADDPAQLDALVAWLREQPQIVAADRDSAVVFR